MKVLAILLLIAVAAHAAPAEETKEVVSESPAPTTSTQPPVSSEAPAPTSTEEASRDEAQPEQPVNGTCACAGFKDMTYADGENPIGTKNMSFTVACNAAGKKECRDMCVALAQANKLKAPAKTCEYMKDVEEGIRPGLYSKACNAAQWKYTGSRAPDVICCRDGKPTPCKPKVPIVPPEPAVPEVPEVPETKPAV